MPPALLQRRQVSIKGDWQLYRHWAGCTTVRVRETEVRKGEQRRVRGS